MDSSYASTAIDSSKLVASPAYALMLRARKMTEMARYDSARVYAEQAEKIYTEEGNKRGIIQSVYEQGDALARSGKREPAKEVFEGNIEKAIEWFGSDDIDYARSLNVLGILHIEAGDYDTALAYYQNALAVFMSNESARPADIAKVKNVLGVYYADRGNFELALRYYVESLELRKQAYGTNHPRIAQSYNNIGNLYKNLNDYGRALQYHKEALAIREANLGETHPGTGASYFNIGNVFGLLQDSELALRFHKKAFRIWEETLGSKHPYVQLAHEAIGADYRIEKDWDRSLSYQLKAYENRKGIISRESAKVGVSLANIGFLYRKKREYIEAKEYYQNALRIALANWGNNHEDVVVAYNGLAKVALELGQANQALHFSSKAISANRKPLYGENLVLQAGHVELLSFLEYQTSQYIKADAYLSIAEALGDRHRIKNYQKALSILQDVLSRYKQVRHSFRSEQSKFILSDQNADLFSYMLNVAIELASMTGDSAHLEQVFSIIEESKTAILLDELYEVDARQFSQIPDSLLKGEKELRQDLSFYERKLNIEEAKGVNADSMLVNRWRSKVFSLNEGYNKLLDHFEASYPDYYELKYQQTTTSIADVRHWLLDEDEALIEYFVGEDSLYVFALTDDDLQLAHASIDSTLGNQVESFRESILTNDKNGFAQSGWQLRERLIAPVLDTIKDKKHWIIVPHGELHYVPFEALPSVSVDSLQDFSTVPYLLQDHSFRYLYSSTIGVNSKKKANRSVQEWDRDFIAFAPVFENGVDRKSAAGQLISGQRSDAKPIRFVLDDAEINWYPDDVDSTEVLGFTIPDRWGHLPFTRFEVEGIEKQFKQNYGLVDRFVRQKTRVLLNDDATEEVVKSTNLKGYRFVHFATHGAINESIPDLSGIAFAADFTSEEDGVLHLGEIYNLELDAELVVLSACETGLGKLTGGEGMIGLARGFKYAGANSLLASLWAVDDASTFELMTAFYRDMLGGKEKAEALRLAKLSMIEESYKRNAPLYWAGFVLIGE